MLKLVGALCVMSGALWWGLSAAGELRRRAETLEGIRAGLAYMEEELTFRLCPLPGLLDELGRSGSGAAGRFFRAVSAGLREDPEGGVRESWRRAMVRQLPMLMGEERQAVLEVGTALGRYDVRAQSQLLTRAARQLESFRDNARQEYRRLGRVYAALSLAGGAAVVLVLI